MNEGTYSENLCRFEMTRRSFIQGLVAGGSAALLLGGAPLSLAGCNNARGPQADLYQIWRELQQRLRQSPDHTPSRARTLVANRDIKAIHAFVRDEIRLMSAEGKRFALGERRTHGKRAALRAGCGTALEKAEILADMVRQTGGKAEIVLTSKLSRDEIEGAFFRDFSQPFEPAVDKAQVEQWRRSLGLSPEWENKVLTTDPTGGECSRLVETISKAISESSEFSKFGRYRYDDRQVGYTPVVKVTEADGSEHLADPVRPESQYQPMPEKLWTKAVDMESIKEQTFFLAVEASRSDRPDEFQELVSGEWPLAQVAGRQLQIAFTPTVDFQTRMASRVADIRTFLPTLSLQALDDELANEEPSAFAGDAFTLGGERISINEEGELLIDSELLRPSNVESSPKEVATIEGKVDHSRFPELHLKLSPRDRSGNIVEGLGAEHFALRDQGSPVGGNVLSTQAAPKVLFLADSSMSMPSEFRGGRSSMQELVKRITQFAKEIHPAAVIRYRTTGSSMWAELVRASTEPVSLIVYATDGDLNGRKPDAGMLELLKQGPPAFILDVDGKLERYRSRGRDNIFDLMAQATNGEAFSVIDQDVAAAEEALKKVLRERGSALPYTLRTTASNLELGSRTISVQVGEAKLELPYTVEETESDRVLPNRLARLRLRFRLGRREVVKHLAGWPGSGKVEREHQGEVQGALFGSHLLAVEGPPPSLSVLLDDMIQAKLSMEELDKAIGREAPMAELEKLLASGFAALPGELTSLLSSTGFESGSDFSASVLGCRTVLYSVYPKIGTDLVLKKLNLIPLEQAYVIAEEKERSVKLGLQRSAPLAIAESKLLQRSTWSMLQGKPLVPAWRRTFSGDKSLDETLRERWHAQMEDLRNHHPSSAFFTEAGGQNLALWGVERESAQLIGLLPDGSGGGSEAERIQKTLDELDQVVAMLNLYVMAAQAVGLVGGLGAFSLGVVAAYGQRLARLYGAAALSVVLMDPSGIEPAVRLAIAGMACEVAKSLTLNVFSGAGKVAAKAATHFAAGENVAGSLGLSSPFSCSIQKFN